MHADECLDIGTDLDAVIIKHDDIAFCKKLHAQLFIYRTECKLVGIIYS